MRLYCQQGLSSRVVQALRTRLERTLRMAAEEGHGHGGSSRIRSRSRGRGAEADAANLGPENSTVLDSTGAGMGDVAGPPAGAEVGDGTVPLADGSVPPGGTMPEGTHQSCWMYFMGYNRCVYIYIFGDMQILHGIGLSNLIHV